MHWDAVSTDQCCCLLQACWTLDAQDYLALVDSTGNTLPIVRQGTLVYLTPSVILHLVLDAASCVTDVLSRTEHQLGALGLDARVGFA